MVLSAGTSFQPVSQARVASLAALELGVSPEDTLLLESGLNTEMEASAFVRSFGLEQLLLVTSAMHMPRAMLLFEFYGAKPIAAPTAFLTKADYGSHWVNYLPASGNIERLNRVWHEYLGVLWFKLKGLFR